VAVLIAVYATANGDFIRYEFSGNGSGTWGSESFVDQNYMFTVWGDLEDWNGNQLRVSRFNFFVDGVGNADALPNQGIEVAKFGDVLALRAMHSSDFFDIKLFEDIVPAGVPFPEQIGIWVTANFNGGIETAPGFFYLTADFGSEVVVSATLIPTPCRGDCSPEGGNGIVNIDDLLLVISSFGENNEACDFAPDFGDGTFGNDVINTSDLIEVLNAFGPCL
jgi:hypothetical protein